MSEHIRLTAAEIGSLWSSYMTESASIPMLKYFLANVEDSEIKSIINLTLTTSQNHLMELKTIFKREAFPIPIGFSLEDVNLNAPRLFSDTYFLYFIRSLSKAGIASNGAALSTAAREDIRKLYNKYLVDAVAIEGATKQLLLTKGIFVRPPHLPTPKEPEFVKNEKFLKGWFGEKRPLTAEEITHIYLNYNNNIHGKSLLLGFAQTSQFEKVKRHFLRGVELSKKIISELQTLLEESHLPAPMTWDAEVTDNTVPVFSDKLMMFQTNTLTAMSLANIGGSMALSFRRDIAAKYSKQLVNVGLYAEDGAELMINNGWLELPPISANRKDLIN
ncbi:DUF3231 family protein [Halalkalibacter sp. APA_J-10(15)]|uniref:DUF3231 family protein n=1 Tax=unclassified Halalkalibacter TaxID=2893063 RepID=UPI001FF599C1|nr:DUF3231 family protein [Halalkalibacter sp. APA_J-10(15)]MCK0471608.1 DUF3231 family protein [Halalkalibacter sp. APA_J-10(15)]